MRFFEVDREGIVRGEARMSRLDASRNLRAQDRHRGVFPDGLVLVPAPADVFPHIHRLDWATKTWVRRDDPPPPAYQEARRGSYPDARAQLAVLTDWMFAVVDGRPLPLEDIAALRVAIESVKADHPKPKTPPA